MSALPVQVPGPILDAHPVVVERRRRELLMIGASAVIPLALALAISVAVPHPSLLLLVALAAGGLAVVVLMAMPRYEITVMLVALYIGLLDGPVKLGNSGHGHSVTSVVRDVLIAAVALGGLLRLSQSGKRVKLPPLAAWPLALAALVVVEAFNPKTHGILKALGGFRQQLEWLPFFFFGYLIMRSKKRFRGLFLLLGVLALANGVVATYQTRLGPSGLAAWGPGYSQLVYGTNGVGGRTYSSEGEAKVRPPGLGSDSGFGGAVGVLALTGTFALLATGRLRRRWPILLLSLGAMVAIATGLGRLQLVGGVLAIVAFAALTLAAGRRVSRPFAVLLTVAVVAIPLGVLFVSLEGAGTFSRYTSVTSAVTSGKDTKENTLAHLPAVMAGAPFGLGLGVAGAASGFGGGQAAQRELFEGHTVSSETTYNFVADELGLPGLLLWIAFTIRLGALVLPRLRQVRDFELHVDLAAVAATIIAFTVMGTSGPTLASSALGPFFWFAAGVFAYWFAGPGWAQLRSGGVP
jgi:hypothetical protein